MTNEITLNKQMQSHLSSDSMVSFATPDNCKFPKIPSSPTQLGCSSFQRLTSSLLIRRLSNRLAKNPKEYKDLAPISCSHLGSQCDSPSSSPNQIKVESELQFCNDGKTDDLPWTIKQEDATNSDHPNLLNDPLESRLIHSQDDESIKPHPVENLSPCSELSMNLKSSGKETNDILRIGQIPTKIDTQTLQPSPSLHSSLTSSSSTCDSPPAFVWPSPNSSVTSPGNFKKILRDRYLHSQTHKHYQDCQTVNNDSSGSSDCKLDQFRADSMGTNLSSNHKSSDINNVNHNVIDFLLELIKSMKNECNVIDGKTSELKSCEVHQQEQQQPQREQYLSCSSRRNSAEILNTRLGKSIDTISKENDVGNIIANLSDPTAPYNPEFMLHLLQTYQTFAKQQNMHHKQHEPEKIIEELEHNGSSNLKFHEPVHNFDELPQTPDGKSSGYDSEHPRTNCAWSFSMLSPSYHSHQQHHPIYHHHHHHRYPHHRLVYHHDTSDVRLRRSIHNDSLCQSLPMSSESSISSGVSTSCVSRTTVSSAADACSPVSLTRLYHPLSHICHKTAFTPVSRIRKTDHPDSSLCSPNSAVQPMALIHPRSAMPYFSIPSSSPCSAKCSSSVTLSAIPPLAPPVFVFPPPSPLRTVSTCVSNVLPRPSMISSSTSDGYQGLSCSSSSSSFSSVHSMSSSISSVSSASINFNSCYNFVDSNALHSSNNKKQCDSNGKPIQMPMSNQSLCQGSNDSARIGFVSPGQLSPFDQKSSYPLHGWKVNRSTKTKRFSKNDSSSTQSADSSTSSRKSTGKISRNSNGTHVCSICSRQFSRSDMLVRHAHVHTGHRPFGCSVCGQSFSRSDHLSTHQRTHTGQRPYRCVLCSYSASRRDMITRHLRVHQRRGQLIPNGGIGAVMQLTTSTSNKLKSKSLLIPYPRQNSPVPISNGNRARGVRRSRQT